MEVAVADNRNLAESLQTIGRDVRAALDVAVTVPEGAAADATQADLSTWQSPGETGWAQAESAALAVEDQATHHVQLATTCTRCRTQRCSRMLGV